MSKSMGDLLDPSALESAETLETMGREGFPVTRVTLVSQLTREDVAGTRVTHEFSFSYYEEEFYVGLVGVDEANNTGEREAFLITLKRQCHEILSLQK
jgi:hypothetical protein